MKMRVRKSIDVRRARGDLLVVPVPADPTADAPPLADIDDPLGGVVTGCIADGEVTGAVGEVTVLHTGGRLPAPRVVLVGVGGGGPDAWRAAGRAAGSHARDLRAREVAVLTAEPRGDMVTAFAGAFADGNYRFTRYRTDTDAGGVPARELRVHLARRHHRPAGPGIRGGDAVETARDLGNTPANHLTPAALAAHARTVADARPHLRCTVLGQRELVRLKAGAILAVAEASALPPAMIVLRYTPERHRSQAVLGLVGKAVTFDTGGISIKPSGGMEEMKLDMAGGAAVLEAMGLIARIGPPVEVIGVIPCAENMVSGAAMRPGDVITAMNGRTIEVLNTDAEGRLLLADALCHAVNLGATHLVDLATLTGSIVSTFGEGSYAGLFGSDPRWTDVVRSSADDAGEMVWPMPMHEDYRRLFSSRVADLANNTPKRWGHAIAAAMFLREFTSGLPWCHLDIAGTGMVDGAATGYGVSTLLHVAEALALS
ncbi:MAG: leucyl aminopeptidase [Thermoleophilia bacterium]